jgi:hypothetical protein
MKRLVLFVSFVLLLSSVAGALTNDLTVRFYSISDNVTIDLQRYLGEGNYTVNKTGNVDVIINPEKNNAIIIAKPNWTGVEVIQFGVLRSGTLIEDELDRGISTLDINISEEAGKKILFKELDLDSFLNNSFIGIIESIQPEKLRSVTTNLTKTGLSITLNEEITINLIANETTPIIHLDMTLPRGKPSAEEIALTQAERASWILRYLIAFVVVLALIGLFIFLPKIKARRRYIHLDKIKSGIKGGDAKRIALISLKKLQKNINRQASIEFIRIFREFFAAYYEIKADFKFHELRTKISAHGGGLGNEIMAFTDDVANHIFGQHNEEWAGAYGHCNIPKKELKKLIQRFKAILRRL